jgi:deoxyadenosine/deoxycytidine kinase
MRGIPAEMLIEEQYLARLINAYTEFFHYYDRSTLLMVNCASLDFVNNEQDYQLLIKHIATMRPGSRNYFNPRPSLI